MRYLAVAFAVLTAGCYSTVVTGITEIGPNAYVVAEPLVSYPRMRIDVEDAAVGAADAFCALSDLRAVPLDFGDARSGRLGYYLSFECLPPDHPAYTRFLAAFPQFLFPRRISRRVIGF